MDPITIALALGVFIFTSMGYNWKTIIIFLTGKKLAVLGDKGTGKTTLLNYLIKKVLSQGYYQTRYVHDTDEQRFYLNDKWISLKKSKDVGGDTSFHDEWEKLFKESDLIFYMVRSNLLINDDPETNNRVKDDLELIQGWRNKYDSNNRKKLLIICTFCDLLDINELNRNLPRKIGSDELSNNFPILYKAGVGMKVVLGSLFDDNNNDNTRKLVELIFQETK
ncbi:MAG: hypothetical protein HEQ26_15320 [Dolichospermum sp. DL01]|nr:MAG: hypothetical protein HEQ26_15320 [Dolichospermum sp. DL01]